MTTGEKLRYMGTAFAVSFLFPLPLLPCLLMDNAMTTGLAHLCFSLLTVPGALALFAVLPLVCGWQLAARAHFPPALAAKFLPLLLPPCFYLFLLSCHLRFLPLTFADFRDSVRFLLLPEYGLFFLAFLLRNRKREPARDRRRGLACLLLTAAVACAAVGVNLHAVRRITVLDDTGRMRMYSPDDFTGIVLPAEPPTLRLAHDQPRLDGTPAALPLYAAASHAVDGGPQSPSGQREQPAHPVVECNGMQGWKRLADGEATFFFGPPPSQRQRDELRARGLAPVVQPVAREALVFFVHADNPVDGLTGEQLRRIYAGEIVNWREVGGRNERILPFQHAAEDENQQMLERLVLRGRKPATPLQEEAWLAPCDNGPVRRVAAYRNGRGALGFGLRAYLDKWFPAGGIRLLAVDGVTPADEMLRNGSYPFTLPLCMTSCRPLDAPGSAFRDWLLGPEGRDLIRRAGFLPWEDANNGKKNLVTEP